MEGEDLLALEDELLEAFGLRFPATASWSTVADTVEGVRVGLPTGAGRACATSMVFYRLRRALAGGAAQGAFRPETSLTAYVRSDAARFFSGLQRSTGLSGTADPGWMAAVGGLAVLVGIVAVMIGVVERLWLVAAASLATVAAGAVVSGLDRGELPRGVATIGDLARYLAARNYPQLVREGATVRGSDIEREIVRILSSQTGVEVAKIGPATRLWT